MRQSQKILEVTDIYTYRRYLKQMLIVVGVLLFSLFGGSAFANPFESSVTSQTGSCPFRHKMYYLGSKAPDSKTDFPVVKDSLSWTAGVLEKNFIFDSSSNPKTFTIKFSKLIDITNSNRPEPPFYADSFGGATLAAINLSHNSTTKKTNHILNISVDRSVSKVGYKIQDLDSTSVRVGLVTRIPYREQVDVSPNKGFLTSNTNFHDINSDRTIVTAKSGINCGGESCNINANWDYNLADTSLELLHNNDFSDTSGIHTVGYSDFYFCLAPPKLIVKKQLSGKRISDNDQFQIEVKQGNTILNNFTTTGSSSEVNNNSSSVTSLVENGRYTITELVVGGGNIRNYNASYTCNNTNTRTPVNVSSNTLAYDDTTKTRSFVLDGVSYGDEITCTITNTPINNYTFTGFVFNDNGGIARSTNPDTKSDVSATFMNNSKYFNGKFDSGELGIYDINLKVRLTDCGPNGGTDITGTTPQTVSNIATTLGRYQFTVPANAIANKPRVCLVQVEPNSWDYSIDTTPNIREVTLKNDVFDYKTEGLVNLDFGEVEADYAAIVLRKAQYVNDCPSALVYSAPTLNTAGNTNTRTGFSESGIGQNSLIPGQCIAYRITATNRANLPVSNFVMRDILQKKGDKGALVTSVLTGPIDNDSNYALTSSVPIGENGTVVTTESVINSKASRRFYFNTKYGTTVNP